MSRIEAQRRVAADPASVALLLAGPAAAELWGARPGRADAPVRLDLSVPGRGSLPLEIAMAPPQRRPAAFTAGLTVSGPLSGPVTGRLALDYAGDPDPAAATQARVLVVHDEGADVDAALTALVSAFLGRLVTAAEGRSRAA